EAPKIVFEAALAATKRRRVGAAQPNFALLLTDVAARAAGEPKPLWHQQNEGNPGVAGADNAAVAAWTITRGRIETRIPVLGTAVDTSHPALAKTVVAEKDLLDDNDHARPDPDDPHGTACAGIIFSRDGNYPGLASECGLVAVRIARGDGEGNTIFDNYT